MFKNNSEEFAFNLSTHGAWMLIDGIRRYLKLINRLFKSKMETADYCFLMICTAHEQAVKVREWAVKNEMQNINLTHLDELIGKIEKKREKFRILDEEIMRKERKNAKHRD